MKQPLPFNLSTTEGFRRVREVFDTMIHRLGLAVSDLGKDTAGDATALHARRKRNAQQVQQLYREVWHRPAGTGASGVGKSTAEKMALHRQWREDRYNKLCDAVYARRGWTSNAIPTLETLKKLRIDFPAAGTPTATSTGGTGIG